MRRRCFRCFGLMLIVLSAAPALSQEGRAPPQYRAEAVKAAFLYRFAGYVDWPSELESTGGAFTIAVLGATDVARQLEQLLGQQRIKNLPAHVRSIDNVADLGDARVLFLGASQHARLKRIIDAVAGKPVLVVTDDADGLQFGSIINLMEVERRIRFEISLTAAQRAGLRISADLLSVAVRVQSSDLRLNLDCALARMARAGAQCGERVVQR